MSTLDRGFYGLAGRPASHSMPIRADNAMRSAYSPWLDDMTATVRVAKRPAPKIGGLRLVPSLRCLFRDTEHPAQLGLAALDLAR